MVLASSLIGQLRILLGLETAAFETGSKKVKSELGEMRAAAEAAKGALELVGVSLAATFFVEYAKGALEYAASLETTANRVGVTVTQLQVMHKAARDNGIATDIMDQALARLNLRLGQAQGGLPAAVKAFHDLHITDAQIASFHNGGDALAAVQEGLHRYGDSAKGAAAGQELLSRAALNSLPAFSMGKAAYDEMYDSAVKAGLITTEQAHQAHEAMIEIDDLAIAIKVHLAEALVDILPALEHATAKIGEMISVVASAVGWYGRLIDKMAGTKPGDFRPSSGQVAGTVLRGLGPAGMAAQWLFGIGEKGGGPGGASMVADEIRTEPKPPPLDLSSHHHRKTHDKSNEIARDNEKIAFNLDKETLDAKKQQLEAQLALTTDADARTVISGDLIQLEHDQQALEIQHKLRQVELDKNASAAERTAAETSAKKQLELNDHLTSLRQIGLTLQAELQREKDNLDTDQALADAKTSKLQLEESIADTTAERRKIELEILQITNDLKRKAYEATLNSTYTYVDPFTGKTVTTYAHGDEERRLAAIKLGELNANEPLQQQQIKRSQAGPLEQLYNAIPATADRMNAALQQVAADGITQLNDGLSQASANWIRMGGVAGDVLRSLYSGLMKLLLAQVEKPGIGFLQKLLGGVSALSGGGGSGFGDATDSSIDDAFSLPHFAGGGSMVIGGMAGIDQNTLELNGSAIARVGMGEKLSITPANDAGGPAGGAYYDMRGAFLTKELFDYIDGTGQRAAFAGGALGSAGAQANARRAAARAIPTGGRR